MKKLGIFILLVVIVSLLIVVSSRIKLESGAESGKYVISANDQRFILTDGLAKIMDNPADGTITILDFSVFPPKTMTIADVPCSVIGPPTCVAVGPDEKIAIISSAMKVNPDNPKGQIPDNCLSVIDLESKKLVQTLAVGNQPSGISISPDGKYALVCNRADGTITTLKINGKIVSVEATVKVCQAEESLSHVVISPDNKFALATLNKSAAVLKIPLKKGVLQAEIERVKVGKGPYVADFMPDNKTCAVANITDNSISILEFGRDGVLVADTVDVGLLPEGFDVSPDGNWIIASCIGNTMMDPNDPNRRQYSQLVLLKKTKAGYSEVQRIGTDRIAQAAVFSPGLDYVVVAGFENQRLTIYKFEDGKLLNTAIVIPVPGQPCTLRTAH